MIEQLKNIAREAIEEQIKENIDSALIFKYVSDLENENKELKERIGNAREYIKGGCKGHDYHEYDYILELLKGDK